MDPKSASKIVKEMMVKYRLEENSEWKAGYEALVN
jgi:hypothetical protein